MTKEQCQHLLDLVGEYGRMCVEQGITKALEPGVREASMRASILLLDLSNQAGMRAAEIAEEIAVLLHSEVPNG